MLASPYTTPWARHRLMSEPMEALELESLRRTTPVEGRLALFGQSGAGPWRAAIYTDGGPQDGYRGEGRTLLDATRKALLLAEATE